MPSGSREPDRFSRALIHAGVVVAPGCTVDVVVVHLKSRRPDYREGDSNEDAALYAKACLRSLVRRGTEAVALRVFLCKLAEAGGRPRVVLGDFNDVADAVTTTIVSGDGSAQHPLFDACRLQRRQDALRHVGFSIVHEGQYSTIDHILLSPQLAGRCSACVIDRVPRKWEQPSDHAPVVATID